jgi:hypothetical protein
MERFYFYFSPNNSGTTIISQYLANQVDGYLPPFGNFEGQKAPEVRDMMRDGPWDPGRSFDWTFIRAAWERLLAESGRKTFIEASPPNMLRVQAILEAFDHDAKACLGISNPYLQISSCLKNYTNAPLTRDALRQATDDWVFRASVQRNNVNTYAGKIPLVRYEDFCRDPTLVNKAFGVPVRDSIQVSGKRKTKVDGIMDLTAKNIGFLSYSEIQEINRVLDSEQDLLSFFGYDILNIDSMNRIMSENPALTHSGLLDRLQWETGKRRPRREKSSQSEAKAEDKTAPNSGPAAKASLSRWFKRS